VVVRERVCGGNDYKRYKTKKNKQNTPAIFSLCRGDHWPRAVTIASSLDCGCGLSLECGQDGCNGTCVKLEA